VTADPRVDLAREYLTGARRRKVNTLPPSVLMRELAETRRQLGQVLDVTAAGLVLTEEQRSTVLSALDVAAEYLRERATYCAECEASPAELCDGCALRLSRADDYDALSRELREGK
jgi:hypothetical protein